MLKAVREKLFISAFSVFCLLSVSLIVSGQKTAIRNGTPKPLVTKTASVDLTAVPTSVLSQVYPDLLLPGNAFAGVVPAPNGRLYGLTYEQSGVNQGTLYSVDAALSSPPVVEVVFNGANGAIPYDELTFDAGSGKFYGTTDRGGTGGNGTIFSYVPGANAVTTLVSADAVGPLVVSGGFIYGTFGGGFGGVFRMATDGTGYTAIHNFSVFNTLPQAVTLGSDGRLYGVTLAGGIVCHQNASNGCGTVFRLRAVLPGDTDTQFQTLYQAQTYPSDAGPQRTVVYGSDGLIYFNNHRRIYRLDPNNPAATFQTIWDEPGGSISMSIIEGSDGRLYAASYDNNQSGAGTVFSLNRDGSNRTILRTFSFTTGSTAYGPYGRLYRSPSGIVYGTTEYTTTGNAYGVVFALSESPSTKLKIDGGNILIGSPGQGMILRSPNGTTCVKVGIDNTGAMVVTPMTCP